MNPFTYFIAAPFGNYLKYNRDAKMQHCVSVTGTWTLKRRGGWLKRIWRIASTLRYDSKLRGWTNRLGLPNEGLLYGLNKISKKDLLSIAAIEYGDWIKIYNILDDNISLEINLSCPNVDETESLWQDLPVFCRSKKRKWCIAKISPLTSEKQLQYLIEKVGFQQMHLCNTLPSGTRGGLSGPELKPYVIRLIDLVRSRWGNDIELIAGGGVRTISDVNDYISAGANHISLGTVCFTPWKVKSIIKKIPNVNNQILI